jgi:hypothetical protein
MNRQITLSSETHHGNIVLTDVFTAVGKVISSDPKLTICNGDKEIALGGDDIIVLSKLLQDYIHIGEIISNPVI